MVINMEIDSDSVVIPSVSLYNALAEEIKRDLISLKMMSVNERLEIIPTLKYQLNMLRDGAPQHEDIIRQTLEALQRMEFAMRGVA
jgi:hypothetical protein